VRLHGARPAFALALGAAALAPAATAGPTEDAAAVRADYAGGQDITPCRFSRQQLVNARNAITSDDDQYVPGYREEVGREIRRWDSGGCASAGGGGTVRAARFKIVTIRPRGRRRESVTIRNVGNRTGNLRRYSLRDRAGNRIRFRRSYRLRRGRRLRVVTGCFRRRRRAVRRGARLYACKRRPLWNDRGDVVRLVNPRGRRVSQRGYRRFRGVRRF
jgi:hypothetical protein